MFRLECLAQILHFIRGGGVVVELSDPEHGVGEELHLPHAEYGVSAPLPQLVNYVFVHVRRARL